MYRVGISFKGPLRVMEGLRTSFAWTVYSHFFTSSRDSSAFILVVHINNNCTIALR
jgi:hypothetical protein